LEPTLVQVTVTVLGEKVRGEGGGAVITRLTVITLSDAGAFTR